MIIFWPIQPPKPFHNRHIHTIIINRSQSMEHILRKNFIIMRVSVKFFPNFIAIITRLELYCQNSGQLKFKPFIRKNMYRLQNMRRKIIFFWIWPSACHGTFFEKIPPKDLLITNLAYYFIISFLRDIDGQQLNYFAKNPRTKVVAFSRFETAQKTAFSPFFLLFENFEKYWLDGTNIFE